MAGDLPYLFLILTAVVRSRPQFTGRTAPLRTRFARLWAHGAAIGLTHWDGRSRGPTLLWRGLMGHVVTRDRIRRGARSKKRRSAIAAARTRSDFASEGVIFELVLLPGQMIVTGHHRLVWQRSCDGSAAWRSPSSGPRRFFGVAR